jgi:hypothetical protein
MAAIDNAIAAIELREPREHFSYRAIATQFGVDCTTLSQRHRGCQTSQEAQRTQQQKLNPQQEEELVRYIEDLTKRALPPTREMIQNGALELILNATTPTAGLSTSCTLISCIQRCFSTRFSPITPTIWTK